MNSLISFIGTTDGNLLAEGKGPILSVASHEKYNTIYLIATSGSNIEYNFHNTASRLEEYLVAKQLCREVEILSLKLEDVTDHNEIYPKLLQLCRTKLVPNNNTITAAIASGTPAMQVCWILMAESGDFPLKLVRSNEPKYGKKIVTDVQLGTGLPRIMRLQEEVSTLKKLLPKITLNIRKAQVLIGETVIPLSPIQLCYYRYFLEEAIRNQDAFVRFSGLFAREDFQKSLLKYFRESYPDGDDSSLSKDIKNSKLIMMATFRGNINKLNNKIVDELPSNIPQEYYTVTTIGSRNAKTYGVAIDKKLIQIK